MLLITVHISFEAFCCHALNAPTTACSASISEHFLREFTSLHFAQLVGTRDVAGLK